MYSLFHMLLSTGACCQSHTARGKVHHTFQISNLQYSSYPWALIPRCWTSNTSASRPGESGHPCQAQGAPNIRHCPPYLFQWIQWVYWGWLIRGSGWFCSCGQTSTELPLHSAPSEEADPNKHHTSSFTRVPERLSWRPLSVPLLSRRLSLHHHVRGFILQAQNLPKLQVTEIFQKMISDVIKSQMWFSTVPSHRSP